MRLVIEGVTVTVPGATLVSDAHLDVPSGAVCGVLGPNGSGKSSLLRTVYRALRPSAGVVRLDGDDVWALPAREAARRSAVVAQESSSEFDLDVLDVVLMGRTPHKGPFAGNTPDDLDLAAESLRRVEAAHLSGRTFATLSGGEKQRVLIARALTQQTALLLLDEPTNHLDVTFQFELLRLIRELGVTVVAALHDLNLAAAYCDAVTVLAAGRVVAAGPPAEVLTPALVLDVFGVRAYPLTHPGTGRMVLALAEPDRPPRPVPTPQRLPSNAPPRTTHPRDNSGPAAGGIR